MKKSLRIDVYQKYNGHCAYCGKSIEYEDMQVDHYYPKRSSNYIMVIHEIEDIDALSNLMPSCRRCNHYKRSYLPEDFRNLMKTLHERVEQNYIAKVAIDFGIVKIYPFDGVFYFEKK